jgi:hypothetical protein
MLALRTCSNVLIVKECRIGFIDRIFSGLELEAVSKPYVKLGKVRFLSGFSHLQILPVGF